MGNSGWFAQGEEGMTQDGTGEQTGPQTPSPGAAQCPVPAQVYRGQNISTALLHAPVTEAFKSSKLRSNLSSFHSAMHRQHTAFGIKAQHCYRKQFKLFSSPPYQSLGEQSHKLTPRLPRAHVQQHVPEKTCSSGSQNCCFD